MAEPCFAWTQLGAAPAVGGTQLDTEQLAHLAVEVGEAGLRTRQDPDLGVALGFEPFGENAQGHGLAGSRQDKSTNTYVIELAM